MKWYAVQCGAKRSEYLDQCHTAPAKRALRVSAVSVGLTPIAKSSVRRERALGFRNSPSHKTILRAASGEPGNMVGVLQERTVVIHEGVTPWWVPLAVSLGIALVAAVVSYAATWWFKKREVDRDNAVRAAALVDEAEQIAARRERWEAEGGAARVMQALQEARVRAQPLGSDDLDDRFRASLDLVFTWGSWQPNPEPVGALRWTMESVSNIREGLVPFLAAPRFLPFRQTFTLHRSFPRFAELDAMPRGANGQELMTALNEWKEQHP
jgi:hypothetical protein